MGSRRARFSWRGPAPAARITPAGLSRGYTEEGVRKLDLEAVVAALHLKVLSGKEKLKTQVKGGYTGDLLSDVMANSAEGDLWITRQTHQNIIAVATLKEHAGVTLVAGSEPPAETVDRAAQEGLPLLLADMPAFDVAGRLYELIADAEDKPPREGK
jgi:hypothetical protein